MKSKHLKLSVGSRKCMFQSELGKYLWAWNIVLRLPQRAECNVLYRVIQRPCAHVRTSVGIMMWLGFILASWQGFKTAISNLRINIIMDFEPAKFASTACNLVEICWRFRDACCLHLRAISVTMEAARTFKSLVNLYQSKRRYSPEESHLFTCRHEKMQSDLLQVHRDFRIIL
jgi:hypothetical protein